MTAADTAKNRLDTSLCFCRSAQLKYWPATGTLQLVLLCDLQRTSQKGLRHTAATAPCSHGGKIFCRDVQMRICMLLSKSCLPGTSTSCLIACVCSSHSRKRQQYSLMPQSTRCSRIAVTRHHLCMMQIHSHILQSPTGGSHQKGFHLFVGSACSHHATAREPFEQEPQAPSCTDNTCAMPFCFGRQGCLAPKLAAWMLGHIHEHMPVAWAIDVSAVRF